MSFICGSLHNQVEEDYETLTAACSTPRKSTKSKSFCQRSKESRNPYADRGLDKFSALLADLDLKRQKILTQKGSEDISLVCFMYSNSNDCKPIVVKVKDRKQEKTNQKTPESEAPRNQTSVAMESNQHRKERGHFRDGMSEQKTQKKVSFTWGITKLGNWRRPSNYLPLFVALILLLLSVFGRSFTILCTSIGWYLLPRINGSFEGSSFKGPKKANKEYAKILDEKVSSTLKTKKEYARGLSKKISSSSSTKKNYAGETSESISSPTSILKGPTSDVARRRSF